MKAVIAAGGFDTRFGLACKTIPKAMLPILGKPIVHHQVEMLLESGIVEILIVVRNHADLIHEYFGENRRLLDHLDVPHAQDPLRELRRTAKIAYTHEMEHWPYGDAEAVLAAQPWVGPEPFYCLWVDDLFIDEVPLPVKLQRAYTSCGCSVVAVQPRCGSPLWSSVSIDESDHILHILKGGGGSMAQLGHFIFTSEIFDAIEEAWPKGKEEFWIGNALNILAKNRRLVAHETAGRWLDVGDWKRYCEFNAEDA